MPDPTERPGEPRDWRIRLEALEAGQKALEERVARVEFDMLPHVRGAVPSSEAEGEAPCKCGHLKSSHVLAGPCFAARFFGNTQSGGVSQCPCRGFRPSDATTMAACPFGCGARFAEPEIWERCPRCGGSFSFNRPLSPVQPSVEPSDTEEVIVGSSVRLCVRSGCGYPTRRHSNYCEHHQPGTPGWDELPPSGEGQPTIATVCVSDSPRVTKSLVVNEGQPEGAEQEGRRRRRRRVADPDFNFDEEWAASAQPLPVPTGAEQEPSTRAEEIADAVGLIYSEDCRHVAVSGAYHGALLAIRGDDPKALADTLDRWRSGPVPTGEQRLFRNEDTEEGRRIWAAVDKAAERAPSWKERAAPSPDSERERALEIRLEDILREAWVAGFRDGWERGHRDTLSHGERCGCPPDEVIEDNEWQSGNLDPERIAALFVAECVDLLRSAPSVEEPTYVLRDIRAAAHLLRAPSVQQREPDRLAESITDDLFRNGFGEVASRLELIAADESSLGGWSRDAFTERLRLLLRAPVLKDEPK